MKNVWFLKEIKKLCEKNDGGNTCKKEYPYKEAIISNENYDCSKYIITDDTIFMCQKNSEK